MAEGNGKSAAPVDNTTRYTVLAKTAEGLYEIAHEGNYATWQDALRATVERTGLGSGDAAAYSVVATRFLEPRSFKIETKTELVFT